MLLLIIAIGLFSTSHSSVAPSAPWVGDTLTGAPCIGNPQGFGPYDYLQRNQLTYELNIVEQYHFNEVKQELDYTLRAWPNHHRALYAAVRRRIDTWDSNIPPKKTPAECYLQRAINFSPKDATARMLYAMLLHSTDHKEQALEQYRKALEAEPAHVQAQYNMGLLLVDMKEYEEANDIAKNLYSRGYPLPGLKNKLIKAKAWKGASKNSSTEKNTAE